MRVIQSRKFKSLFLVATLLSQMLLFPSAARATVVVMVGQPNVWSLEQAHYLLAQIRERNLGLRNKFLDESDLDPNALSGTRLDAYRSLFELGVSFDQGLGLKNQMNRQNLEFNQTRRQELFARRSALFDEKANLLAESGRLNAELSSLEETDANADAINQKKREIKSTTDQINAINQRIENLTTELNIITAGSTDLSSPSPPPLPSPLGSAVTDRIGKSITEEVAKASAQNSRLAASLKLDNYIQMQYELLAKQLTLLRDEVSPRQRLLFLELPTSIYATPGRGDERSVQSWWELSGYYRDNKYFHRRTNLRNQRANLYAQLLLDQTGKGLWEQLRLQRVYDTKVREINKEIDDAGREFYAAKAEALEMGQDFPFATPDSPDGGIQPVTDRDRTIDLIPRQSSLNVNDVKEVVKERGFKALFSLLIGIGGSVNYQQRRDHFEQFQQQEVYAAGFGKGSPTFGWTFNPAPGTKRLTPGIRTTYAVMVIPRDATRIQLRASGHQFRTNEDSPTTIPAPGLKTFTIEVPNGPNNEGFFVTRIDYPTVKVNQTSVVILRGNFSNQTGVLINGTALTRTVGLANPLVNTERGLPPVTLGAPDSTVKGNYEVINSNQLIMSFLMPAGFIGTPKITLVSPNRARLLNDLKLNINGTTYGRLDDEFRVGSKPDDPKTPLTIADIQISPTVLPPGTQPRPTSANTKVNLTLVGKKSGTPISVYFNAIECRSGVAGSPCQFSELADRLFHLEFSLPFNLEAISFTVIQDKEIATRQVDNPVFLRAAPTRILYEPGDAEDPDDDYVTVILEGKRIEDLIAVSDQSDVQWQSQSFNQGVLVVTRLSPGSNIIRLTDGVTGSAIAPISIRKRPPKAKKPASNTNDNL